MFGPKINSAVLVPAPCSCFLSWIRLCLVVELAVRAFLCGIQFGSIHGEVGYCRALHSV